MWRTTDEINDLLRSRSLSVVMLHIIAYRYLLLELIIIYYIYLLLLIYLLIERADSRAQGMHAGGRGAACARQIYYLTHSLTRAQGMHAGGRGAACAPRSRVVRAAHPLVVPGIPGWVHRSKMGWAVARTVRTPASRSRLIQSTGLQV
jgi:hypothetical protein